MGGGGGAGEGLLCARIVAPWAVAVACLQNNFSWGEGGVVYTAYVVVNQPRIGEPN